jgi:hypothetical protein
MNLPFDPETMRATGTLPKCRNCEELARPNLMMFRDWGWLDFLTDAKEKAFRLELGRIKRNEDFKLAVVEIGAGTRILTVRDFSEGLLQQFHTAKLIRVNPLPPSAEDSRNPRIISIQEGALKALERLTTSVTSLS